MKLSRNQWPLLDVRPAPPPPQEESSVPRELLRAALLLTFALGLLYATYQWLLHP